MITNEETTELQLAVEANDLDSLTALIAPYDGASLSRLQLFGNHTLLMYACEHCSVDVVKALLAKEVTIYELEWSDNNELKSVLRNEEHREQILPLILEILPPEIAADMIATNWDPDPDEQSDESLLSPLEMAQGLADKRCLEMLKAVLG